MNLDLPFFKNLVAKKKGNDKPIFKAGFLYPGENEEHKKLVIGILTRKMLEPQRTLMAGLLEKKHDWGTRELVKTIGITKSLNGKTELIGCARFKPEVSEKKRFGFLPWHYGHVGMAHVEDGTGFSKIHGHTLGQELLAHMCRATKSTTFGAFTHLEPGDVQLLKDQSEVVEEKEIEDRLDPSTRMMMGIQPQKNYIFHLKKIKPKIKFVGDLKF